MAILLSTALILFRFLGDCEGDDGEEVVVAGATCAFFANMRVSSLDARDFLGTDKEQEAEEDGEEEDEEGEEEEEEEDVALLLLLVFVAACCCFPPTRAPADTVVFAEQREGLGDGSIAGSASQGWARQSRAVMRADGILHKSRLMRSAAS